GAAVGNDLAANLLADPRCAEPGARGAAHGELLGWLVAQCQLTRHPGAEVTVVLEASRHVGEELGGQLGLEVRVGSDVGAMRVGFVAGSEAGEYLRPGELRRIVVRRTPDPVRPSAVRGQVPAVDPGGPVPPR